MPPAPFRSELLQLDAPNNMIDEIWNVVFEYTAPSIEVSEQMLLMFYKCGPLHVMRQINRKFKSTFAHIYITYTHSRMLAFAVTHNHALAICTRAQKCTHTLRHKYTFISTHTHIYALTYSHTFTHSHIYKHLRRPHMDIDALTRTFKNE